MEDKIKNQDLRFMRLAIDMAKEGIRKGQTPFGACIVKNGKVIACHHNLVWKNTDITSHAEITTIGSACRSLERIDLSGCTIYSTSEPCPMCFSACHWARISRIAFGCTIKNAQDFGFNELVISNSKLKKLTKSKIEITPGLLIKENIALFEFWRKQGETRVY